MWIIVPALVSSTMASLYYPTQFICEQQASLQRIATQQDSQCIYVSTKQQGK